MLGDVVGSGAKAATVTMIPTLRTIYGPDFLVVNGENSVAGRGISRDIAQCFFDHGVNVITLGNHTWDQNEIISYLEKEPRILRPENFPPETPGRGYGVYLAEDGTKVGVANLQGRIHMDPLDDPFRASDTILDSFQADGAKVSLFDFHAEATSEKQAFGHYVDGRASIVVGTHTHVQTADEQLLPRGTAYITDVGMCGPQHSVIGMDKENVLRRFLSSRPHRYQVATGPMMVNGIVADVDQSTGHATKIERISVRDLYPAVCRNRPEISQEGSGMRLMNTKTACKCAIAMLILFATLETFPRAEAKDSNATEAQSGTLLPLNPSTLSISPMPQQVEAASAPAPAATVIYDGSQALGQGSMQAEAWGGGSVQDSTDKTYNNAPHSIEIMTQGLYQGARIDLPSPVALGDLVNQKTHYLQLTLAYDINPKYPPQSTDTTTAAPSATPAPSAFHRKIGSFFHLVDDMAGTGTATAAGQDSDTPPTLPLTSLHLTFVFADGTQVDVLRPVPVPETDQTWVNMGVALSQLPLTAAQKNNPQLTAILLGSDSPATIYIGQMKIVYDTLPITCKAGLGQDIAAGDTAEFNAIADGGASNLKYEWDFDTNGDFVTEATGRHATYQYSKSGVYTVTLRVSDADGLKQPAMATTIVHVED